MKNKIIAVDFDGTLCEHKFPEIGNPNTIVLNWILEEQLNGTKFILWTCREGYELKEAINWCKQQGIIFDAINENISELKNKNYAIRKPYADIYLDDKNMNLNSLLEKEVLKRY